MFIVTVDNGERVEFFKMTSEEVSKFDDLEDSPFEINCYPLDAVEITPFDKIMEWFGEGKIN